MEQQQESNVKLVMNRKASSGQGEKDQRASEGNLEYFCLKVFQF